MMTLRGLMTAWSVQEAQARVSESEGAALREAQSASQGESAALQDTVKLQASEISALRTAKENSTAKTAELEGQLEGLQAALQAAQQQSETDSVTLKELQDAAQQAQVCTHKDATHSTSQRPRASMTMLHWVKIPSPRLWETYCSYPSASFESLNVTRIVLQGDAGDELRSLHAAVEGAKAEAAQHKRELDEAQAQHRQHVESGEQKAQHDRDVVESQFGGLEGRIKELQAELAAAEQRLQAAAAAEQQHAQVVQDMHRLEAALEQLKQEQDTTKAAWQQAREQTAAQNQAADERHRATEERAAALEETIRQAREEDVAQIAKLEEWQRTATQAAEVEAHLEIANQHIQQLEQALTHAQEQAEAAEVSRRDIGEVRGGHMSF